MGDRDSGHGPPVHAALCKADGDQQVHLERDEEEDLVPFTEYAKGIFFSDDLVHKSL